MTILGARFGLGALIAAALVAFGSLTAFGVASALLIAGASLFVAVTVLVTQPVPAVARLDGAVALPRDSPDIDSRVKALWIGALVVMLLVIVDVPGILLRGPAWRYGIVLIVPVALALASTRGAAVQLRRPTLADRFLIALIVFGLIGSIYGKVVLHSSSPALVIFIPMTLGLLHLALRDRLDEHTARRILGALVGLGVLYTALHAAASMQLLNDPAASYTHEKAFLLALALTAVWLRRNPGLFVLLVGLSAVIFTSYAAGTYAAVAVTTVLTLVATSRRAGRARPFIMGIMVALVLFSAFSQMSRSESLAGNYFQSVGKNDNTLTRRLLWDHATEEISRSPVVGSFFAGDISVEGVLPEAVPLHNDFLQIAMLGGLVGLALFAGWLIAANRLAVRQHRMLVEIGADERARLLRLCLVGLNTIAACALFNPLLAKVGLGTVFFLLYALMQTIAAPEVEAR